MVSVADAVALVRAARDGEANADRWSRSIDFEEQGLTDEHVIAIAEALADPAVRVEALDLSKNEIGDDAAEALADALGENTTLRVLKLYFTNVGDYGATCLACALPLNTTLWELRLAQTNVSDDGAEQIVSMVRKGCNTTLRHVSFNSIRHAGASPVSQTLRDETESLCAQNVPAVENEEDAPPPPPTPPPPPPAAASRDEFLTAFGCSRREFEEMPPWKQHQLRLVAGLVTAPLPRGPPLHGGYVAMGRMPVDDYTWRASGEERIAHSSLASIAARFEHPALAAAASGSQLNSNAAGTGSTLSMLSPRAQEHEDDVSERLASSGTGTGTGTGAGTGTGGGGPAAADPQVGDAVRFSHHGVATGGRVVQRQGPRVRVEHVSGACWLSLADVTEVVGLDVSASAAAVSDVRETSKGAAAAVPQVEPEERVRCLLDLPDDALDALAERLTARSYARFTLACRACAAAAARVVSVVVPAAVAQRLRSNRCAGQLACAKCPVMELPAGVLTKIGEDAFRDCDALRSIHIPPGVNAVHRAAFADCTSLSSVHLPPSVTFIGPHAFNFCKALTSIALPDGNECIDSYTFANCSALTTVTLPESVCSIEEGAFESCRALASINIPEGIKEIDETSFENCDSLDDATREIIKDGHRGWGRRGTSQEDE